jgi:hypothetical protein
MWRSAKLNTRSTEPGSSQSKNIRKIVDELVRESRQYNHSDEFVTALVSQFRISSATPAELESVIGALRIAVGEHLRDQGDQPTGLRCHFCGRSQKEVLDLVASAQSAICNDCVLTALESILLKKRHIHIRIAYALFRFIASVGYRLTSVFGFLRKE